MKKIDPDLKNIVLAKIMAYDDDYELIIGGSDPLGKDELIKNVKEETQLGEKIATIQLEFMQDLVNGKIYQALANNL